MPYKGDYCINFDMVISFFTMKTFREIQAIREKYEKEILSVEDVVGIGIGKRKETEGLGETFCIRIYVAGERPLENIRKSLPARLEDVEVEIVTVGRIRAQNANQ